MYSSKDILRFLDGSLSGEEEAELLHRLSVSPERRDVLRGYMNQNVLFQRDRDAIAVPYSAEQKLWAKLGEVMPPVLSKTAGESVAPVATQLVRKPLASWVSIAMTGAMALLVGFGSGFLTGKNYESPNTIVSSAQEGINLSASPVRGINLAANSEVSNNKTATTHENRQTNFHRQSGAPQMITENEEQATLEAALPPLSNNQTSENTTLSQEAPFVSSAHPRDQTSADMALHVIADHEQYTMNPFEREQPKQKTFWERTEFQITESFGKQYPDNAATRVSFPVVTNSSISAFHQPFQSLNLWLGAGFGTGNLSKKLLQQYKPYDPNVTEIKADVAHVQTSWVGGFAQYRFPIVGNFDITTTLGLSGSTAGMLSSAEIGSHFLVTQQVGLAFGFRVTNLSYNLNAEMESMKPSIPGGMGFSQDLYGTQNSQNYDVTAGIFFHF